MTDELPMSAADAIDVKRGADVPLWHLLKVFQIACRIADSDSNVGVILDELPDLVDAVTAARRARTSSMNDKIEKGARDRIDVATEAQFDKERARDRIDVAPAEMRRPIRQYGRIASETDPATSLVRILNQELDDHGHVENDSIVNAVVQWARLWCAPAPKPVAVDNVAAPIPKAADGRPILPNVDRDNRQSRVFWWAQAAFGASEATSLRQRGIRLLEEAIEAFQAPDGDFGSYDISHLELPSLLAWLRFKQAAEETVAFLLGHDPLLVPHPDSESATQRRRELEQKIASNKRWLTENGHLGKGPRQDCQASIDRDEAELATLKQPTRR